MNKFKKNMIIILILSFFSLFACQDFELGTNTTEEESLESNEGTGTTVVTVSTSNKEDHEEDGDYTWDNSSVETVTLNATSIESDAQSVTIDGSIITISDYGNYEFTGSLSDGQIIVDIEESLISSVRDLGKTTGDGIVRIILNGVDITNSSSSPIFIASSDKTIIVLNSYTDNYVTDGSSYAFENAEEDEPNAAVFSKDDLTIFGSGNLIIDANYNDGIASKDGLIIKSGNITINATDDGIRGKDYVVTRGGNVTIVSGGDGIKSDNEEESDCGYISIESGDFNITSTGDAITAQTDLTVTDGDITIKSGGGSSGYSSSVSNKGIKSVSNVIIDGGTFTLNTADDAIHSNSMITINSGEFSIASGDDAIHADSTVEINGGEISITKSYEGIESAVIVINDGDIEIISSDDGLNVAGGNDGSGGRGGHGGYTTSGNYYMYINGGNIAITASGDGLDANGSIVMTGGTVLVHGPTSSGNGAIDYDGSYKITGGILVAAGSSGMAQAPGSSSSQYSILLKSNTTRSSGTIFHIENSSGDDIVTFKPSKNYQSVAFSSPDLSNGSSYKIYFGGSSTGTVNNGLYSGGTYSGGSLYKTVTISSIVTNVN